MTTQVQFRRGTTSQNNAFTGVVGEISVDTTLDGDVIEEIERIHQQNPNPAP